MTIPEKITITIDVNTHDLWSAVWSADGAGSNYWCSKIRTIDGGDIALWVGEDMEPNPQDFTIYDHEADEWYDVSLIQLANGYAKALSSGQTHCGDYPLDINDPDGCFGDIVLQHAVFGEMIYG